MMNENRSAASRRRSGKTQTTDETLDELGPIDWIVVEFPGSKFNGEIAPALRDLVQRGIIRVLDLLVLKKDADGSLEAFELSDLDPRLDCSLLDHVTGPNG